MHTSRNRCLILGAAGLMLACLGGLSGCGSKPKDGEMIQEAKVSAEEKARVKAFYANRHKAANKKPGRRR